MSQSDNRLLAEASHAREALEKQLQDRSDVCFVDIGYPQGDPAVGEISLRIHICEPSASNSDDSFPSEVSGIPVVVSTTFERK